MERDRETPAWRIGETRSSTGADDAPEAALSLLREQDALYTELESVVGRQRKLITQNGTGPLLSLLADRQKLAVRLMRIARQLEPLRSQWPDRRARMPAEDRDEADLLLSNTSDRLRRMIAADEEDARFLAARTQSAGEELQSSYSLGRAIHAYQDTDSRASRIGGKGVGIHA